MKKHSEEILILQGNEACALAALDAGCGFFAGYPITPSTEIIEYMAAEMPKRGGNFIQMEDEIASACAIIGARWAGVKAMTATSGPGFSLMQESIGFAAVTETPVVIANVQRGGPSTGQPTLSSQQDIYQARYGSHGDYEIIALAPSSVQEMYDHTIKAFELAERYRSPVILLADEIIGHMREKLTVGRQAVAGSHVEEGLACSPSADFFTGHNVLVEGQLHNKSGHRIGHIAQSSGEFVRAINAKIADRAGEIADVEGFYLDDANIVLLCYGSVARAAMDAVHLARGISNHKSAKSGNLFMSLFGGGRPTAFSKRYRDLKVGLIKVNTVWPFPEERIRELTAEAEFVVVPEMNIGKYSREVERALPEKWVVSHSKCGGDIHTPQEILDNVLRVAGLDPAVYKDYEGCQDEQ